MNRDTSKNLFMQYDEKQIVDTCSCVLENIIPNVIAEVPVVKPYTEGRKGYDNLYSVWHLFS
jgi:hypothetical protein